MGIKESNPSIRGKSFSLKSKHEEKFFNRTHMAIKKISYDNTYSDYNLIKSLEKKNFVSGVKKPDRSQIKDITWIEYLIFHINRLHNIFHSQWTDELLQILEGKNIIISQNKYFSNFFYHEYQIKTIPEILVSGNDKIENNPINDYDDICSTLYNTELSLINDNKNYNELDITENLGGSYLEINYEELKKDNIAFQYQMRRDIVKKYIKLFKEHIYNNSDHPINIVISFFNKSFSKYIHDKIKELENQLEKEIINQDKFDSSIKELESEITSSLQEIISVTHSAVKLFYSTTLDFMFFEEEKDDLINLITSFFFRTGQLYENILELYSYSFKDELKNFQEKLIELKSIKPNKLGIDIKFCLNEDTIKLQNELKNKKQKSINKKVNEEEKQNNTGEKKNKKTSLFQKLPDNDNGTNLFTIKEKEEEKESYSNKLNDINILEGSRNKEDVGQYLYYIFDENDKNFENKNNKNNISDYNIPIRSRTKLNASKEDYLTIERFSFLDDNRNDYYNNSLNQMRNSVNNFNYKIMFFPKLNEKLKNNINHFVKRKISKKKSNKGNNLPIPYLSAINLLKSSKNYKTPFEKIILIAAISDQIMENANSFWKDMAPYIEKDYLFIEADEIMTIFLYIIIQAQMPDILLFCKIIKNFTTQFTKAFNISYNYTLLEASIDYINELKDVKELMNKDNGFLDASRSILGISNQRLSSFGMGLK